MKATKQGQEIAGRLDHIAGRLKKAQKMPVEHLSAELHDLVDEIYNCVNLVYRLDERGRTR